jgi:hypothetical protein
MTTDSNELQEVIERRIFQLRGVRAILDVDLAFLYGVKTYRLNEQVKRNIERFPADFVFRLTEIEAADLISQTAISGAGWGGRRTLPLAFTEHGALMAASVLSSPKAIEMSILVVRAFVKLKALLVAHRQLSAQLGEVERRLSGHDEQIATLVRTVRALMAPAERPRRQIGFRGGNR